MMGRKSFCGLLFDLHRQYLFQSCWQPLEAANIITPQNTKVFGRVNKMLIVIAPQDAGTVKNYDLSPEAGATKRP